MFVLLGDEVDFHFQLLHVVEHRFLASRLDHLRFGEVELLDAALVWLNFVEFCIKLRTLMFCGLSHDRDDWQRLEDVLAARNRNLLLFGFGCADQLFLKFSDLFVHF